MMEIRRGYLKGYDKDGNFVKTPLYLHPERLAAASPRDQAQAEEVRLLHEAAEEKLFEVELEAEETPQVAPATPADEILEEEPLLLTAPDYEDE